MGLGRVKTFRPRETGDAKLNLACWHLWRCRATGDGTAYRAVEDLHFIGEATPKLLRVPQIRSWQTFPRPMRWSSRNKSRRQDGNQAVSLTMAGRPAGLAGGRICLQATPRLKTSDDGQYWCRSAGTELKASARSGRFSAKRERQSSGRGWRRKRATVASLFTPATRMIAIHYDLSPHQWNVPRSHKSCK